MLLIGWDELSQSSEKVHQTLCEFVIVKLICLKILKGLNQYAVCSPGRLQLGTISISLAVRESFYSRVAETIFLGMICESKNSADIAARG